MRRYLAPKLLVLAVSAGCTVNVNQPRVSTVGANVQATVNAKADVAVGTEPLSSNTPSPPSPSAQATPNCLSAEAGLPCGTPAPLPTPTPQPTSMPCKGEVITNALTGQQACYTPTPGPSYLPTPTPAAAVSAPPITFPFVSQGLSWKYNLSMAIKGKQGPVMLKGTVTILVSSVTADGATLSINTSVDSIQGPADAPPSPVQGAAKRFTSSVSHSAQNPYSIETLFPQGPLSTMPDVSPKIDTVTSSTAEHVTVTAGGFDATRYTLAREGATNVLARPRVDVGSSA